MNPLQKPMSSRKYINKIEEIKSSGSEIVPQFLPGIESYRKYTKLMIFMMLRYGVVKTLPFQD